MTRRLDRVGLNKSMQRRTMLGLGLGLASGATIGNNCSARATHDAGTELGPVQLTSTTLGVSVPTLSNAAMMVAGPADSATANWAALLDGPLGKMLQPGGNLSVSAIGGRDGVTGANAFEALINPDGSTALLVPGTAAIAWLAGDPRVHFDAGRWIPALTSFGSAVLMRRPSAPLATLRVAASTPSGTELPALLGLSLLGYLPVPVFGLADPKDAHAALLNGRVDAVLLTGRSVPQRALNLWHQGIRPVFSLGIDPPGAPRDPALAQVPTLPDMYGAMFGRQPAGLLFDAWKATAAAVRLDAALVLQPLTPASLVAQWRRACAQAIVSPALADATQAAQLTPLSAPDCVAALSAIVADQNTLLTLRRWIASRTDWRPA